MRTYMQIEAQQLFSLIFMSHITNDSSLIEVRSKRLLRNVLEFNSPRSISIHSLQWFWKAVRDNNTSIKKLNA